MILYVPLLLLLLLCVDCGWCAPIHLHDVPSAKALDFMKRYGYIEGSDGSADAIYTEEGLQAVIRTIQKFGAIPQTGKLDNATLNLMSLPRCGVPDIIRPKRSKRFVLGPMGWKKRNITYFIANWPSALSEDTVTKYITLSLTTWGRYGRLHFTRINTPDADIVVAFGRGHHGDYFPFDGPGNVLAHAFFPYEYDNYGGDVHFDDDENWTLNDDDDGVDFYSVAIHELGHSLGLSHSHVPSSIMFPYYTSAMKGLDYDDILGMYELYIKRRLEGDDNYDNTTMSYDYTNEYTTQDPFSTTTQRVTVTQTTTDVANVTYEGDFETVDEHKRHDTTHGIPTTNSPSMPDICDGNFDEVANFRNELFIFKGEYIWRLTKENALIDGYPIKLHQMFASLPKFIKRIDAAYERPDGMIILFTGDMYWIYNGNTFVENSPRSLNDYGLPIGLSKIDAVQKWAKNGKTYFYRGNVFWRYNEINKTMDSNYPKHMERWRGVPHDLDAAVTWKGLTYFFKGKCFWRFDNDWIIISENSPQPAPQLWLDCPKTHDVEIDCSPNFTTQQYENH